MVRITASKRENALRRYADGYAARQREANLRAAADTAPSQEREQDKERTRQAFLSGLNHELRTPLNHIIGFGELLKQADAYCLPEEKRTEYINVILNSAHTLLEQINSILTAAGYGEPSGERSGESSLVPLLRQLLQEHAASVFVGKVYLADDLPEPSTELGDLYPPLQSVFQALASDPGVRRTIGVSARPGREGHEIVIMLALLSGGLPVSPAKLQGPSEELERRGGHLDLVVHDTEEKIVLTLPANVEEAAA